MQTIHFRIRLVENHLPHLKPHKFCLLYVRGEESGEYKISEILPATTRVPRISRFLRDVGNSQTLTLCNLGIFKN
jgi:hypothetical protein